MPYSCTAALLAWSRSIPGVFVGVATLIEAIEAESGAEFEMAVEHEEVGFKKKGLCPGLTEMISYLLTHPSCPESINSSF